MANVSVIKLKVRRGLDSERKLITLDQGEIGYTTDSQRLFVGDGVHAGGTSAGMKYYTDNILTPSPLLGTAQVGDIIFDNNLSLFFVLTSYPGTNGYDSYKPFQFIYVTSYGSLSASTIGSLSPLVSGDISPLIGQGNATNSVYESLYNIHAGLSASTDITIYNDTSAAYIDMGITSSLYNGNVYSTPFTITRASDSYIYSVNGNIDIGTTTSTGNSDIVLFTGGTLSGTKATGGNEVMRLTNTAGTYAGNIGIGTSTPNATLTVAGSVSASQVISASGGNSNLWNTTYGTVSSLSANWNTTYRTVSSLSANWNTTYGTVSSLSANWNTTYGTVSSLSANWNTAYTFLTAATATTLYLNNLSASGGLSASNLTIYGNISATGIIYSGQGIAGANSSPYIIYPAATGTLSASIVPLSGGNIATNGYSLVAGGSGNQATGYFSSILGGSNNRALSAYDVVAGGFQNIVSDIYSNINGGTNNQAASAWSVVGGGNLNRALSGYAIVAGGWSNCATNWASTVNGGYGNISSGSGSSIGGGLNNTASGIYTHIGGGRDLKASGNYTNVTGGYNNTASGNYSFVAGGSANDTRGFANTFILGTSLSATAANSTYVNNIDIQGTTTLASSLSSLSSINIGNFTSTAIAASASPLLSFDQRYSPLSGVINKINLWGGTYGFGVAGNELSYIGQNHIFYPYSAGNQPLSSAMIIAGNGNIGIGNNVFSTQNLPSAMLTVAGSVSAVSLSANNIFGNASQTILTDGSNTTGNGSGTITLSYLNGIYLNSSVSARNVIMSALTVAGNLSATSVLASSGIGYSIGNGGTVTQLTTRGTGVTLNKPTGTIVLVASAATFAYNLTPFVLTNSFISSTDIVFVQHSNSTNPAAYGLYTFTVTPAAGQATINVRTLSAMSTDTPTLQYTIVKSAVS